MPAIPANASLQRTRCRTCSFMFLILNCWMMIVVENNDDCYPVATASTQGLSPKPPESVAITLLLFSIVTTKVIISLTINDNDD